MSPAPAVAAGEDQYNHQQMCQLTSKQPMSEIYLEDQLDAYHNATDLTLVCADGHISVHRYILMASSPLLKEILMNRDPSEPAVIHLDNVKIRTLNQIMSLIYTGNAIISSADQIPIFSMMQSLGIITQNILFRPALPSDNSQSTSMRYAAYSNEEGVEIENSDSAQVPPTPHQQPPTTRGSAKDKARLKISAKKHKVKLKVGLPNVTLPTAIFAEEDYQCITCLTNFDSEPSLIRHLTRKCAQHLCDKFEFAGRNCLICNTPRVAETIWGLLSHVEVCSTAQSEDEAQARDGHAQGPAAPTRPMVASNPDPDPVVVDAPIQATEEVDLKKAIKKRRKRRFNAYNITRRRKPKKKPELLDEGENRTPGSSASQSVEGIPEENTSDEDDADPSPDPDPDDNKDSDSGASASRSRVQSIDLNLNFDKNQIVDQDIVRKKHNISSIEDISKLPGEVLQRLFQVCCLCENEYSRIKDVERCLRFHGYRFCWVCLKLFPATGFAFDAHVVTEHCRGENGGQAKCPLCDECFEYKIALPAHLGNVHGNWSKTEASNSASATVPVVDSEAREGVKDSSTSTADAIKITLPTSTRSKRSGFRLSAKSLKSTSRITNTTNPASDQNQSMLREILSTTSTSKQSSSSAEIPPPATSPSKEPSSSPSEKAGITISKKDPENGLTPISNTKRRVSPRSATIPPSHDNDHDLAASAKRPRPSNDKKEKITPTPTEHENKIDVSVTNGVDVDVVMTASMSKIAEDAPTQTQTPNPDKDSDSATKVTGTGSGRKFLRKSIINGVIYNIYCNDGDSRKIIAIPDNLC